MHFLRNCQANLEKSNKFEIISGRISRDIAKSNILIYAIRQTEKISCLIINLISARLQQPRRLRHLRIREQGGKPDNTDQESARNILRRTAAHEVQPELLRATAEHKFGTCTVGLFQSVGRQRADCAGRQ